MENIELGHIMRLFKLPVYEIQVPYFEFLRTPAS